MMIEQPAASAPAILRTGVSVGKFHGVKAGDDTDRLLQHELTHALLPAGTTRP